MKILVLIKRGFFLLFLEVFCLLLRYVGRNIRTEKDENKDCLYYSVDIHLIFMSKHFEWWYDRKNVGYSTSILQCW